MPSGRETQCIAKFERLQDRRQPALPRVILSNSDALLLMLID